MTNTPNQGVELLACPFCGGEAERYTSAVGAGFENRQVQCRSCGASAFDKKWQTRATPTPASSGVLVEAMERIAAGKFTMNEARGIARQALSTTATPASEPCRHEAWNEVGMSRRCVDCGVSLPDPTSTPASDGRLRMFLEILAASCGQADAGDYRWNWINAFCGEHEGRDPDTFNLAHQRGFTTVSHDTDTDQGMVYLTDAGRAFLATAPATNTDTPDRFGEGYRAGVEASAKVADRYSGDGTETGEDAAHWIALDIRALHPATGDEA